MLERRLSDVATQLRGLRRELAVTDEQLAQLADEADDARLRSLVSETPIAEREHREAARHAEAMDRHRADVLGRSLRLEAAAGRAARPAQRGCRLTRVPCLGGSD